MDTFGDEAEHGFRKVEGDDVGGGVAFEEDTVEAAFAGTDVEDAAMVEVAEGIEQKLDVVDARVDGGGEVLLIACGFIEGTADLAERDVSLRRSAE